MIRAVTAPDKDKSSPCVDVEILILTIHVSTDVIDMQTFCLFHSFHSLHTLCVEPNNDNETPDGFI